MRKPSTLDALIGYFTPSHVIHQRLLLQFLSAPEDGRKKRPKRVESNIAVINKHTAKLHHVGSLYILTYDARELKHKTLFYYMSILGIHQDHLDDQVEHRKLLPL